MTFLTFYFAHGSQDNCRGLPNSTGMGMANSYVRVSIAGQQRKTAVKRGTGTICICIQPNLDRSQDVPCFSLSSFRSSSQTPTYYDSLLLSVNPIFNEQMAFRVLDHTNYRLHQEVLVVEAFFPGVLSAWVVLSETDGMGSQGEREREGGQERMKCGENREVGNRTAFVRSLMFSPIGRKRGRGGHAGWTRAHPSLWAHSFG